MNVRHACSMLVVAVGLWAGPAASGFAQDTPPPKDDSIDSLLEKLAGPSVDAGKKDDGASSSKRESGDPKKAADSAKKPADSAKKAADSAKKPGGTGDLTQGKKKAEGSEPLSGKDQEVDELLEKLGQTTETPAPDNRRGAPGGGDREKAENRGPGQRPEKTERNRLSGKDEETDKHLEELAGRKRRKRQDEEEERKGPAGELIKEMRDIEQKLAKPDTGEGTREEQKKVVKRIDQLIEEARKSGQSSMRRLVMRRTRQQGQERGQQQGQQEGAMAQGAPATKPQKPPSKHSSAGGKDIWGHLPPEMRAEIENMINEQPLSTKEELIKRYYLSVNKKQLVREETP